MKSIIKTNQPEVGHGIAIFDPTNYPLSQDDLSWRDLQRVCDGPQRQLGTGTRSHTEGKGYRRCCMHY